MGTSTWSWRWWCFSSFLDEIERAKCGREGLIHKRTMLCKMSFNKKSFVLHNSLFIGSKFEYLKNVTMTCLFSKKRIATCRPKLKCKITFLMIHENFTTLHFEKREKTQIFGMQRKESNFWIFLRAIFKNFLIRELWGWPPEATPSVLWTQNSYSYSKIIPNNL